jgi:spore germination protein YaaH
MPILALFNKKKFHELSGNPAAWARMNDAMIREAKLHGYSGFQFDFEDISYLDRDALTAVVKASAEALHKAGLQLSIATVPNAPGYPAGKGGFAKWIYTDWRGAFDIAELAKYVDLLCLMTYDQNTRWTMPGPVAGWQWTLDNLDYALKVVPKEKLSLGIPERPRSTKPPAKSSPTNRRTISTQMTSNCSPNPTKPTCNGIRSTTAPTSGSIAIRCANGSSTRIVILLPIAMN